jgi:hypothetical protein
MQSSLGLGFLRRILEQGSAIAVLLKRLRPRTRSRLPDSGCQPDGFSASKEFLATWKFPGREDVRIAPHAADATARGVLKPEQSRDIQTPDPGSSHLRRFAPETFHNLPTLQKGIENRKRPGWGSLRRARPKWAERRNRHTVTQSSELGRIGSVRSHRGRLQMPGSLFARIVRALRRRAHGRS